MAGKKSGKIWPEISVGTYGGKKEREHMAGKMRRKFYTSFILKYIGLAGNKT
jgi:hypothetical protein